MRALVGLIAAALPAIMLAASTSWDLPSGVAASVVLFHAAPKYSPDAHGSGVVLIRVDRSTGLVSTVSMEKSTGYPILDHSALDAFRRWRFKPHTVSTIHMPITFTKKSH